MIDFMLVLGGGMLFVLGVIAGIGPQNLNVISHAIHRNHELAVASTCFIADAVLLLLGCIGLQFVAATWLVQLINITGIAFLSYFLWSKLTNLNQPHHLKLENAILSRKAAILRALALTWLNPLVFIDTIVIIGGTSAHYHGLAHLAFTLGAVIGDFCWLFGLTLLARRFAAQLNRPRAWMFIDIATIVIVAYVLTRMLAYCLL